MLLESFLFESLTMSRVPFSIVFLLAMAWPWVAIAQPQTGDTSLASFPLAGTERFEVVILGICKPVENDLGECPVEVRLKDRDKTLGIQKLELGVNTYKGKFKVGKVGESFDITNDYSDGEYAYLKVYPRLAEIAPGVKGLIVTEQGGYEHVYRRHVIYISDKGKLKLVYKGGDWGQSATFIYAARIDDVPVVVYFDFSFDSVAKFSPATLQWSKKRKVLEYPEHKAPLPPIYAVIAGSDKTLASAEKRRSAYDKCEAFFAVDGRMNFMTIESGQTPKLARGFFVQAFFTVDEKEASARVADLKKCAPSIDAYVKRAY